jgi:hypothetical protein
MQSAKQLIRMRPHLGKYQYLKRAQKRFLAGTNCKTPEIAVALGARSIKQWAEVVQEELEKQLQKPSLG